MASPRREAIDYGNLSDAEIEAMLRGRTTDEAQSARDILWRRRARARQESTFRARPHRDPGPRVATTRSGVPLDRRALELFCQVEGWADLPADDADLMTWCIARGVLEYGFLYRLGR